MDQNCDLEYYQNNGVIAVRPSETGCLVSLVKKTRDGQQRVWVFCIDSMWIDEDGDERLNHHRKGVSNGTYREGGAFLEMCRELGLSVESHGFFVPFSNGESRRALTGQVGSKYERSLTTDGKSLSDYDEGELKLARWDLPTREELAILAAVKTGRRGGTGHFPGVEQ